MRDIIKSAKNLRNLLGKKDANSTEFDEKTDNPVIDLMPDQVGVTDKGGTMRLGVYPCEILGEGASARAYGGSETVIMERHRHRFEFNNKYQEIFSKNGMIPSGINKENNLIEIIELKKHPWFVGVQFHPEYKSTVIKPHPLFCGFIKAIIEKGK